MGAKKTIKIDGLGPLGKLRFCFTLIIKAKQLDIHIPHYWRLWNIINQKNYHY